MSQTIDNEFLFAIRTAGNKRTKRVNRFFVTLFIVINLMF